MSKKNKKFASKYDLETLEPRLLMDADQSANDCSHSGPCSAWAVRWAQHRAGRKAYHSRLSVQRTDTWLEESLGFSGGDV